MLGVHSHFFTHRLIHRMFSRGISDTHRRRTIREAESCDRCKRVLRRYYEAEAAVYSNDVVAAPAVERMARSIVALVPEIEKPSRNGLVRTAGLAATLSAAICLTWLLTYWNPPDQRIALQKGWAAAEITPRGGAPNNTADFGIRVFSVEKEPSEVQKSEGLPLDGIITFTYTKAIAEAGYLALFSMQKDGDVIWYYPDFGEPLSVPIEGDKIDEPLGDGFKVSVNHRPGPVRIVALFSARALSTSAIEAIASKMQMDAYDNRVWSVLGEDVTAYAILTTVENEND